MYRRSYLIWSPVTVCAVVPAAAAVLAVLAGAYDTGTIEGPLLL